MKPNQKKWKVIGGYLQTQRMFSKKTQLEVSKQASVHHQYISNCERGKCSIPFNIIRAYRKICFTEQRDRLIFDDWMGSFFAEWVHEELKGRRRVRKNKD